MTWRKYFVLSILTYMHALLVTNTHMEHIFFNTYINSIIHNHIGHTNRKFTKPGYSGHLSIVGSFGSVPWVTTIDRLDCIKDINKSNANYSINKVIAVLDSKNKATSDTVCAVAAKPLYTETKLNTDMPSYEYGEKVDMFSVY